MSEEIMVLNEPVQYDVVDGAYCLSDCADCGCENAWNTCFIGD